MHAWSQEMQTLIAARPFPLSMIWGSARKGRDIDTRSTPPAASTASASSSLFTRLPAITGTSAAEVVPVIAVFSDSAQGKNAPAGTAPCTVGTADSCHPTPMFSASTPAATSARANSSTSSQGRDSGISSAPVIRKSSGNPGPTASRIALATSIPKRIRRSASPPHPSSRRFVTGERNWSTR